MSALGDYTPTGRALKAIRYLETQRMEVAAQDLAAVMGLLVQGMAAALARAIEHDYIRQRKHGRTTYYGIGERRLPPEGARPVNLRVSLWSGGGLLIDNGAPKPLSDAQRQAVLEALDALGVL